MTLRIDAHAHLWNRTTDPQEWIDPVTMAVIDRDFGIAELRVMLRSTGMERAVVVQASNSLDESMRLSHGDPAVVAGLVAWVNLHEDVQAQLDRIRGDATVPIVGVRHLLHTDPDPEWLGGRDAGRGLGALGPTGLPFDLVVRDWQLLQTASVVARHPETLFVLDHLGGPFAEDAEPARWERGLCALAELPNVVVKLSGAASALTPGGPSNHDFARTVGTVFDAFGPERVLYGSDWPLAELDAGAVAWRDSVGKLLSSLDEDEISGVLGGNAAAAYSLV
jgi:L-fuconolactonase